MRRFIIVMLAMGALNAYAQGFIDLKARLAQQQLVENAEKARAKGQKADERASLKLFVTCEKGADVLQVAQRAREIGARVSAAKGNFMAVEIPYTQLEALANVEGVGIVNTPPRVSQKLDVTRQVTQTDIVNDGTGSLLPQAYTGKGVVVGVIDCGLDPTHPMFKDKDGNLRVKGLYRAANSTFGGDPVEILFDDGSTSIISGSAYSKPEDLLNPTKIADTDGSHGTYCASIAAGSIMDDVIGIGGRPLGGIAPEADILLSDHLMSESGNEAYDMVECLYYIGNAAEMENKPYVISLSHNSHVGWHDGTSDMARFLGLLSKEGRMTIMLCSSNEGGHQTYLHEPIKSNETLRVVPYSTETDNCIWGGMKTDKNVKMEVGIHNLTEDKESYRIPITFNSTNYETENGMGFWFNFADDTQQLPEQVLAAKQELMNYIQGGQMSIWCYLTMAADQDGNPYYYTEVVLYQLGTQWVHPTDKDGNPIQWGFNLYLTPEDDTELHAWADMKMNLIAQRADGSMTAGTGDCSVGDWNTSGNPVSIGAWVANNITLQESGLTTDARFTLGDVAFFSSYGTDLAGHQFPDVCAPGTCVVAAMNSFDPMTDSLPIYLRKGYDNQFEGQQETREYCWGIGSGTSASTPVAAGIVALWMEAANDLGKRLTCEDVKDIIAHSSDTDAFTEASPERFGHGKINAYKGLLYVLGLSTSIPSLSKEQPRDITFRVTEDQVFADGAEEGTTATIYDLKGVNVRETTIQNGALSTAGLPKGVYAIQLGRLGSTLIRK